MSEELRESLVGKILTEEKSNGTIFFPIQLLDGTLNYNKQQGLIFVTPIAIAYNKRQSFRVGVKSPDDLDMDLDFHNDEIELREPLIEYVKSMDKVYVTYHSVLNELHSLFGGIPDFSIGPY